MLRTVLLSICLLPLAAAGVADSLLVANKSDHTLDVIDLDRGESIATLPTGTGPHEVAVSPDGTVAVVTDYGSRDAPGASLTVVDLETRTVAATIDLGRHHRPHGLAWLDDERLAVTTEGSAHLLVVEPRTSTIAGAVETAQEVSHMVAVTPDGERAFVANIGSGTVTAIDLPAGRKLADIETGAGAEGIAVSPDGTEVWVTNRAADTISIVDPATLEVVATLECPGFPIRIAFTPDGSRALVSAAQSGEVVAFDVAARREIVRAPLDLTALPESTTRLFGDRFGESPVPVGLVISPDGERAWVAATQADVVVVIDPDDLSVTGLLEAGREPDGMAYAASE